MNRDTFINIKSKIKYSRHCDKHESDKAWRVRTIINMFKKSIQQFGFFSTSLSVNEMMVRFFGRTTLKQYIPTKPDKFGLKFWAMCSPEGYLFNLDLYCGKNLAKDESNLSSCALGSKVVIQLMNSLLVKVSKKN